MALRGGSSKNIGSVWEFYVSTRHWSSLAHKNLKGWLFYFIVFGIKPNFLSVTIKLAWKR